MTILFLHGLNSTPGGLKPTYLQNHGHEVLNPALPDEDFDEAVEIAQGEFERGKPDVVVGSSRSGAVAMNINSGNTPLVLLCPAWKRWGAATRVKPKPPLRSVWRKMAETEVCSNPVPSLSEMPK